MIAGVTPQFVTNQMLDEQSIGPWIISHNLHRRHLTASQRSAVAVEFERVFAESKNPGRPSGETREKFPSLDSRADDSFRASDDAGGLFNVSGRSVRDAKFVAERDPDLFSLVKNGAVAVSAAAKRIRDLTKTPASIEQRAKKAAERIYREGNDYALATVAHV